MGRMFGTNGVRGVVNQDMNIKLAMQMGKAVGVVFPGTAAIATDTRVSADMLRTAVSAGNSRPLLRMAENPLPSGWNEVTSVSISTRIPCLRSSVTSRELIS